MRAWYLLSLALLPCVTASVNHLVLCKGLAADRVALAGLDSASFTFPSDLPETMCVTIDPCTQSNANGDSVPRDVWFHRSNPVLALVGEAAAQAEFGAYAFHSIEYARIPDGVTLQVCAPDFHRVREEGVYVCNEDTITSFQGRCPRITSVAIAWEDLPEYCQQPLESSPELVGHIQMMRYTLNEGWGCFAADILNVDQRLSDASMPNTVLPCPELGDIGSYTVGASACTVFCPTNYVVSNGLCVPQCDPAVAPNDVCGPLQYATNTCTEMSPPRYQCADCPVVAGSEILPWTAGTSRTSTCEYSACAAGTFSTTSGVCEACAVNSITATESQSACTACDPQNTGTHQEATGGTVCDPCFSETIDTSSLCVEGEHLLRNFTAINDYFNTHAVYGSFNDMVAFCRDSYACLPCPPGTYAVGQNCEPCAIASYQPNYAATSCFACSHGQTTTQSGSVEASACVCDEGFE